MKLSMSPFELEKFRQEKLTYLNTSQRYCRHCQQRRSSGQFDAGQQFCKRCVLRGAK